MERFALLRDRCVGRLRVRVRDLARAAYYQLLHPLRAAGTPRSGKPVNLFAD